MDHELLDRERGEEKSSEIREMLEEIKVPRRTVTEQILKVRAERGVLVAEATGGVGGSRREEEAAQPSSASSTVGQESV